MRSVLIAATAYICSAKTIRNLDLMCTGIINVPLSNDFIKLLLLSTTHFLKQLTFGIEKKYRYSMQNNTLQAKTYHLFLVIF